MSKEQTKYICPLSHNLVPVYPEQGPDCTRVFAFSCSQYTGFCKSSVTAVIVKLKCSFKSHHCYYYYCGII